MSTNVTEDDGTGYTHFVGSGGLWEQLKQGFQEWALTVKTSGCGSMQFCNMLRFLFEERRQLDRQSTLRVRARRGVGSGCHTHRITKFELFNRKQVRNSVAFVVVIVIELDVLSVA